jgi:hypothetical protein
MLSQAEIDALLLANSGAAIGVPARPVPSYAEQKAPAPVAGDAGRSAASTPSTASPGRDLQSQATMETMNRRLEELAQRVVRMEQTIGQSVATISQIQQELSSVSPHVQILSSRLEGVLANLKATFGYRAQKTFVCTGCQTKGEVAARIKCTHCDLENWWGWWGPK